MIWYAVVGCRRKNIRLLCDFELDGKWALLDCWRNSSTCKVWWLGCSASRFSDPFSNFFSMCFEPTILKRHSKIIPKNSLCQQTSTWDHQHPTAWLFAVSQKKHQKVQRKAHLGLLRRQLRCLPLGAAHLLGRGGGGHLAGTSQLRQRRGFGGMPKRPSWGGCRFFGGLKHTPTNENRREAWAKTKKGMIMKLKKWL